MRELLSYEPDTTVGIMATEFICIKEDMTVEETLKYLQLNYEALHNVYNLYVIDSLDRLRGIVLLDDVIQILRDENTEDIHRLGGVGEGEKLKGTLKESVRSRLPWLLVNLITAILASSIGGLFEGPIEQLVSLATFMPIVAEMGGNAGTQTLTVMVRGLALGNLDYKHTKKIFFKEIAIEMILNMVVATVLGFTVPIVLRKMNVDPALASSVFVTTFTDVLGFFFF